LPAKIVWKLEGAAPVLDEIKVNQFLNSLTRLNASRFSAETTIPKDKPMMNIRFHLAEGDKSLEIIKYNAKDKRYIVRRGNENVLYELDEYVGKNLLKKPSDFKK
jgi:hypothetical protein